MLRRTFMKLAAVTVPAISEAAKPKPEPKLSLAEILAKGNTVEGTPIEIKLCPHCAMRDDMRKGPRYFYQAIEEEELRTEYMCWKDSHCDFHDQVVARTKQRFREQRAGWIREQQKRNDAWLKKQEEQLQIALVHAEKRQREVWSLIDRQETSV